MTIGRPKKTLADKKLREDIRKLVIELAENKGIKPLSAT